MALDTQNEVVGGAVQPQPAALDARTPSQIAGPPTSHCSVGIMAYNEEGNIGHTIRSILGQSPRWGRVTELLVVASGCTDRTAEVVAELAREDPRIGLIVQERREGKASAINLFIASAKSPILMMVGADVLVDDGTIDELLRHFRDPGVGMVGGHPIPVNDETTLMGHAVHLQWRLHDRLARRSPKLGEIVAFRNVVPNIPLDTAVDEISIQALITQLGYRLVYEPRAVVYNRGPSTVADFLRQRRRIHAGHLRVREQQGYEPSTMSAWKIFGALAGSGSFSSPRTAWWTICTVGLEAAARALGRYDVARRRTHQVWESVDTTKRHIADGAASPGQQNVLVFHITNFRRHELELGARASRRVTQLVMQRIQEALGSTAIVSVQQSAIIVALVAGDHDAAEEAARQLVAANIRVALNGNRDGVGVDLAFGIIAFSSPSQALSTSIPIPIEPAGHLSPS